MSEKQNDSTPAMNDVGDVLLVGYHLIAAIRIATMAGFLNKALNDYVSRTLKPLCAEDSVLSDDDKKTVAACMNFIRGIANAYNNNQKKEIPTDFKKMARKLHKFMVFFHEKIEENRK